MSKTLALALLCAASAVAPAFAGGGVAAPVDPAVLAHKPVAAKPAAPAPAPTATHTAPAHH